MSTIYYKHITPWQFIKQAIKNKCWFLGYTWGSKAYIFRLAMPLGDKLFWHTVEHEMGHLFINDFKGASNTWLEHKDYDKHTWHGLLQFRSPLGKAGFDRLATNYLQGHFNSVKDVEYVNRKNNQQNVL